MKSKKNEQNLETNYIFTKKDNNFFNNDAVKSI